MERLWATFRTSSFKAQVLVVGGLLLLLLLVAGSFGGLVSVWKDRAFDKKSAVEREYREGVEKENAKLAEESAALRATAAAAEKREALLAVESARKEEVIQAGGSRLIEIDRKLEEESRRYEKQKESDAGTTLNPCDLWLHNCETAKRLGIKPRGEPCDCSAIPK